MSATIRELFEDVKSADGEAAAVTAEKSAKQRELSTLESRERLTAVRQRETRMRLLESLKPDKPYRLDDTHIVRKVGGRLTVEELQDPEKETVVVPPSVHEDSKLKALWDGLAGAASKAAMPVVLVVVLALGAFGGVALVGYLNGRPDDHTPAPAPDDPSLSPLARKIKKAVTDNLDRDKTTAAEAQRLVANYQKVSAEVQQAMAGAGNAELKDPKAIEARLKALNQASVDKARWQSVFVALASVCGEFEDALPTKVMEAGDYVTFFDEAARAFQSFAAHK